MIDYGIFVLDRILFGKKLENRIHEICNKLEIDSESINWKLYYPDDKRNDSGECYIW